MHAMCLTHLILFDFIILIIYGVKYKSPFFLFCTHLHYPSTSTIFSQNIFLVKQLAEL